MDKLQVRIVRLEPMRVAYALGFGEQPEEEAWNTILAWAKSKGLLDDIKARRFFGFNNPNPSPGSPNYGYEQWITVGPDAQAEGKVQIKEFSGGLYAVTPCRLTNITETWKRLVTWAEDSRYKLAHNPCLEECLTPPVTPVIELKFDLYLPISE